MRIEVKQGRRVPNWVVEHLGCVVQLSKPHTFYERRYEAGHRVLLQSVQAGRRSPYATVVFEGDVTEAEENMPFGSLRPL